MPSGRAGRITQRRFHRRLCPMRGGGANGRMPTASLWAHASWDNAGFGISCGDRSGRRDDRAVGLLVRRFAWSRPQATHSYPKRSLQPLAKLIVLVYSYRC